MRKLLALLAALLMLGACSPEPEQPATELPTTDATEVLIDGIPADDYERVQSEWNTIVEEWNDLTRERDAAGEDAVTVDGETFETFEQWAEVNGHPLTLEEMLDEVR